MKKLPKVGTAILLALLTHACMDEDGCYTFALKYGGSHVIVVIYNGTNHPINVGVSPVFDNFEIPASTGNLSDYRALAHISISYSLTGGENLTFTSVGGAEVTCSYSKLSATGPSVWVYDPTSVPPKEPSLQCSGW